MSLATVKDTKKAAAYSDRFLKDVDESREYVERFWMEYTPEGRYYRDGSWDGNRGIYVGSLDFYVESITDVQSFVFADEGDRLAGVPERAATDSEMDGLLGPATWRRMEAWIDYMTPEEPGIIIPAGSDRLVFAGEDLAIDGVKVVSFDEPGGLDLPAAQIKKHGKLKGYSRWPGDIDVLIASSAKYATMLFFGHWDVCSSAAKCFRVLRAVKLGSSFGIDGDGTVWWWSDPGLLYGWHGGAANKHAVLSCDLQNPVSLKYAKNQMGKWSHERPVLRLSSKGKLGYGNGYLGMYKAQLVALFRVLRRMSRRIGFPVSFLLDADGCPLPKNMLRFGEHDGCATHRDLEDTTKWDVRGWLRQSIIMFQEDAELCCEMADVVEALRVHDPWAQKMREQFSATCRWPELGIGAS